MSDLIVIKIVLLIFALVITVFVLLTIGIGFLNWLTEWRPMNRVQSELEAAEQGRDSARCQLLEAAETERYLKKENADLRDKLQQVVAVIEVQSNG